MGLDRLPGQGKQLRKREAPGRDTESLFGGENILDCRVDPSDISVITEITDMTLLPVQRKFILHWGEMGTRWGINRTVAQVHALLFISARPLSAEEIVDALSVARSNVST